MSCPSKLGCLFRAQGDLNPFWPKMHHLHGIIGLKAFVIHLKPDRPASQRLPEQAIGFILILALGKADEKGSVLILFELMSNWIRTRTFR